MLNPSAYHGQGHGAVVMSSGDTLTENVLFNKEGDVANPTLNDYLIPTSMETPRIHSGFVESYEPRGPFGAKEVGEGAALPVIGALASAIYDATGVRITDLPITPEKILNGLKALKGGSRQ